MSVQTHIFSEKCMEINNYYILILYFAIISQSEHVFSGRYKIFST